MNRRLSHLVALAGALVLCGIAVLLSLRDVNAPILAPVIAAAMGLGYAAGYLRGTRRLPQIATALGRLASGTSAGPLPEGLSGSERRVFDALARTAEELARSGRDRALSREQALFDGRQDALGRLAAGLAGRFGQSLAGAVTALASAERAAVHGNASGTLVDDLASARRALDRTAQLVAGLRALAPPFTPPPVPVSVADALRHALDERRTRAGRIGVTLTLEPAAIDVELAADPETLRAAVGPLIDNALDALDGLGGHVTVAIESAPDEVAIRVDDDGPGLDEKSLERAFEPFFTTREASDGLGLGLAFARAAAERCGGSARLERRAAGGTRATITLPTRRRDTAVLSRAGTDAR